MSAVDPARRAAFEVLRRVFEHDGWADRVFPAAAERHGLSGRERARAQWLAYGAVQRRGTSDAMVKRLADRPNRLDGAVLAALRLGLFELLFAAERADHAAVDAAVGLAKGGMRRRGPARARAASGLVNAVLRRAAAEREELLAAMHDDDPAAAAIAHSVPEWLAQMWWDELGAELACSLLRTVNEPPETAMRRNPLKDAEGRIDRMGSGESGFRRTGSGLLWPREALVCQGRLAPETLAALERGELFAQSRGSQAVVEVLDPRPGERVLDACAGPGTKTVAIAARVGAGGSVHALDRDPGRARQIDELAARAGAGWVEVRNADATEDELGADFDRALVDPPCSDLGTLASRPDARWRKAPEQIPQLAEQQSLILRRAVRALRPGGTVVYSTCTISRVEGEEVVGAVVAAGEAELEDLGAAHPQLCSPHDPRCLQIRPDRDRTDGFFIARLRRPV